VTTDSGPAIPKTGQKQGAVPLRQTQFFIVEGAGRAVKRVAVGKLLKRRGRKIGDTPLPTILPKSLEVIDFAGLGLQQALQRVQKNA
jgi:hypothetical protein